MDKQIVSNTQNLTNFFILPMLQLNKSSFGADNFINSFINRNGYIVINTKRESVKDLLSNKDYITDYNNNDGSLMYVFSVPEEYEKDLQLFIEGKYSLLSPKLKIAIANNPTLADDNIIVKMLNPQLKDRQEIADDLGVNVKYITEIKSPPSESNFISIK